MEKTCPYCGRGYIPKVGKWRKECCESDGCEEKHRIWKELRRVETEGEHRARQREEFKSYRMEMKSSGKKCCKCGKREVASWLTLTCARCFHENSECADEAMEANLGI